MAEKDYYTKIQACFSWSYKPPDFSREMVGNRYRLPFDIFALHPDSQGRAIAIEVKRKIQEPGKETYTESLFSAKQKHQIETLKQFERAGGIALLIIVFVSDALDNNKRVAVLRMQDLEQGNHKVKVRPYAALDEAIRGALS